jgi:8-oxo-dGTP pyrophosphatase MutT (NUDIX family)
MSSHPSEATVIDRGFQLAYRSAYQMMRVYWGLRHPTTHGALVALWNGGEVLLIRNSYVHYYCFPGGYLRRAESGREAALRELSEEVGVTARIDQLELAHEERHEWEGKDDHVMIFSIEVPDRPQVRVDRREVVEARWMSPEDALKLDLFPPLRRMLTRRLESVR